MYGYSYIMYAVSAEESGWAGGWAKVKPKESGRTAEKESRESKTCSWWERNQEGKEIADK